MTLDARSLWVVCKTFGVLPNDPRLADLSPIQIEWVLWNVAEEARSLRDKLERGPRGVTNARDADQLDGLIAQGERK